MWPNNKQQVNLWKGVFIIAPSVAAVVIAGSISGLLQLMEWATLDQFFRLRPPEPIEERIVIVTVDEPDIKYLAKWPMTDRVMAQLLKNIKAQKPRGIGLDIYRDLVVEPGHEELVDVFKSTPQIIGIEKLAGNSVAPPPVLDKSGQVAAADLVLDADGKVRRALVLIGNSEGKSRQGLGVNLALMYLEAEGIELRVIDSEKKIYGLGQAVFVPLTGKELGYRQEYTGGYQILLNFRGGIDRFTTISMTDVLENRIPPDLMRDRIVFIGAITPSLQDVFQTPYSSNMISAGEPTPGVVIHANLTSQILNAALHNRPMMQAWPKKNAAGWILVCSLASAIICCVLLPEKPFKKWIFFQVTLGSILIEILILLSISYLAFLTGLLIPVFSPILAAIASTILTANYHNQWQLKVINEKLEQANQQLNEYSKNLEMKVEERTQDLLQRTKQLSATLQELKSTQTQLIQAEKMSALGQLVAGIAHEINNPTNFIYGNLDHAEDYFNDLIELIELYQDYYPSPGEEIEKFMEEIELEYLTEDFSKVLHSMKIGASRIREIVKSLRTFSRLDEAEIKDVDIHEGIDSTLMILDNRLQQKKDRPEIQVIKEYGKLPPINCYAGQLNQVFMNLLTNAIDAIESQPIKNDLNSHSSSHSWIKIVTKMKNAAEIEIAIADNGPGIPDEVKHRLFDPFFTTKPVGKGTGLGLSISYSIIVEKHGGQLEVNSTPGKGTEFIISIPVKLSSLLKPSAPENIQEKEIS
ncbi:CHASE2 domain-containing protein [Planktothricoides sp. SR001]|uniref:CHASE2 domain-containing protein n=1 Tax=Planktothricoides sp. SR001 TaxID=1705388 RepID=UPI0006C86FB5|nr:CHASE2 domain-containing protein [Planktothricoides sp. SR001]